MDLVEFMAAFALAAFWLNTLLIAAAGWSECAALRRQYSYLTSGTGGKGRVRAGAGPEGTLARWQVAQVGRCNGRGPILFHDRSRTSEVVGGTVTVAGAEVRLAAGAAMEVWIGAAGRRRTQTCPKAEAFAAAKPAATRAAGWQRTLELSLRTGDAVWLVGPAEGPGVLADFDPRRWLRWITGSTAALVLVLVGAAAGCTAACLWPPVFGTVSKLGAFAALVAFNLFQLLGKLHHEAIQPPARATLAGAWKQPR